MVYHKFDDVQCKYNQANLFYPSSLQRILEHKMDQRRPLYLYSEQSHSHLKDWLDCTHFKLPLPPIWHFKNCTISLQIHNNKASFVNLIKMLQSFYKFSVMMTVFINHWQYAWSWVWVRSCLKAAQQRNLSKRMKFSDHQKAKICFRHKPTRAVQFTESWVLGQT